ncbi:MAG TPA: hypothetical protein PKM35_06400 [Holophaga sp.]|nr:hypothetical protein [Holophaga sp.]HPS66606.1 hypothetical protein [Holophaga sp.]
MNGIAAGISENNQTAILAESHVHPNAIPFISSILVIKALKDGLTRMKGMKGIIENKQMLGPAHAH